MIEIQTQFFWTQVIHFTANLTCSVKISMCPSTSPQTFMEFDQITVLKFQYFTENEKLLYAAICLTDDCHFQWKIFLQIGVKFILQTGKDTMIRMTHLDYSRQ